MQTLQISAVGPSYCLLCVDFFSSKFIDFLCLSNEKKVFFSKKLELFYQEIKQKRNMKKQVRLQTDLKFQQREIMKLKKLYTVLMFRTKLRGGKAFAAEQKIREFKKLLLKSKRLHKSASSQRLEPNRLIQRAVNNMNKISSQKDGFSPGFIEEKILNNEKLHEIFAFHKLVKVRTFAERSEHRDIKSDREFRKKLRSLLEIAENVLVLTERLKKCDAPDTLYKSTTENMPHFNRGKFIVRKVSPKINSQNIGFQKQKTV